MVIPIGNFPTVYSIEDSVSPHEMCQKPQLATGCAKMAEVCLALPLAIWQFASDPGAQIHCRPVHQLDGNAASTAVSAAASRADWVNFVQVHRNAGTARGVVL